MAGCQFDLDKRVVSNEGAAIRQTQLVQTTLECYRKRVGTYPMRLSELEAYLADGCGTTGTLQPVLRSIVTKNSASGYVYSYRLTAPGQGFEISAAPLELGKTGRRFFWISERGEIHEHVGGPAGPSDPQVR